LFLALVVLAVAVIESFEPTPVAGPRSNADDVLELRLGRPDAELAGDLPGDGPSSGDEYLVQPGDTLSGIAQRLLGSAALADELARLNGISDPDGLLAGQVIRLR
jgi:nucleoid-associated protein YgaU